MIEGPPLKTRPTPASACQWLTILTGLVSLLLNSGLNAQSQSAPTCGRPGPETVVSGCVQAPSGYRLSHVEVGLRRAGQTVSLLSVQTDAEGNFRFETDDLARFEISSTKGSLEALELVATYPGFDPVFTRLEATNSIQLVMSVSAVQEAITVAAISPTDQALQSNQEFGFLDIVATAGANADPLFAAQTLPGVTKLDDGSGLFVRGGDASEVATYLDRALLDHPYRNETPTGGFFGTVDAFELAGLSLAAGGFPARFGNSLSAVLELRTRPRGTIRGWNLGIGLAAISASFETEFGERAGVRLAANRRDAAALVELNNADLDFPEEPQGFDVNTRWQFQRTDQERITAAASVQSSSIGTELEDGNFVGLISTADDNQLFTATWGRTYRDGASLLDLTASFAGHQSDLTAGVLNVDQADDTGRLRLDWQYLMDDSESALLRGATLRLGAETERRSYDSEGSLPEVGGDFGGNQGLTLWTNTATQERTGAYFEFEQAMGSRFAINLGARWDDHPLLARSSFDPRISASLRTGEHSNLRLSWGLYHQSPAIQYLAQPEGQPPLDLMRAEHRILSWQLADGAKPIDLRIELYEKRYRDLPFQRHGTVPLDPNALRFTSDGFGSARGGDLYVGWRAGRTSGVRGWVAYTYLDAERLYTAWQDDARFDVPTQPFEPDFAIPHTLQLVGNGTLPFDINASFGVRYATGRPFTPAVGANEVTQEFQGQQSTFFVPRYGEINSDRLPNYVRVDTSASRSFVIGASTAMIAFVGINDLFDRQNAFRYVYNNDYSERRLARTAFGRTVYFGISLSR